jgi:hypothetical protein
MKKLQDRDKYDELAMLLLKKRELERKLTKLRHGDSNSIDNIVGTKLVSNRNSKRDDTKILSRVDEGLFDSSESNERLLPVTKNEPNDVLVIDNCGKDIAGVRQRREKEFDRKFVHDFDCECLACSKEHSALLQSFHDTLNMMKRESESM